MRETRFNTNMLQAVVLVGGLGTRLGTVTRDIPKPLVEVGGRPFLDYILTKLDHFGFDEVILLSGYKSEKINELANRYQTHRMRVINVVEKEPLGTAGALLGAEEFLADQFLMMNGDSFFDFNWLDLVKLGVESTDITAAIALLIQPKNTRASTVEIRGESVIKFIAEPSARKSALINGGVYWIKRKILSEIPTPPSSLENDVFSILPESGRLIARSYEGFFIDIGIPEDLADANIKMPGQFDKPMIFIDIALITDGAAPAIRNLNDSNLWVAGIADSNSVPGRSGHSSCPKDLREITNTQLRREGAHLDYVVDVKSDILSADPSLLDFTRNSASGLDLVLLKDASLEKNSFVLKRRCILAEGRVLADLLDELYDLMPAFNGAVVPQF